MSGGKKQKNAILSFLHEWQNITQKKMTYTINPKVLVKIMKPGVTNMPTEEI